MAGNLKHEIRSYIKIRSKLGEKPMKIHETLQTVYGDDAPRYPTVCKWAARFRVGRDSIDDDVRIGRPVATCSPRNITRVRDLVEEDARKTVKDIAALTGISHGSSHEILRHHLF